MDSISLFPNKFLCLNIKCFSHTEISVHNGIHYRLLLPLSVYLYIFFPLFLYRHLGVYYFNFYDRLSHPPFDMLAIRGIVHCLISTQMSKFTFFMNISYNFLSHFFLLKCLLLFSLL